MTNWGESIKMTISTEDDFADLEFETDGEQRTGIYLVTRKDDKEEKKWIGSVDTVDFTRIMARAIELWSDEAELHAAAEEKEEEA